MTRTRSDRPTPDPRRRRKFERWLSAIGQDFDRWLLEGPEPTVELPPNAYVFFRIEIEGLTDPRLLEEVRAFNEWSRELAQRQADPHQPLCEVVLRVAYKPSPKRTLAWGNLPRRFELQPA